MKLIAWDGKLKLGPCCAKPGNRVREATEEDVEEWAFEHGLTLVDREDHLDGERSPLL
jgi:hypothetical protein